MPCGEISQGSSYNCTNPLQGGSSPNITLINYDDVLSVTIGATPNLITGITLKSGKYAYKFTGFGRSVTPQQEVVKLTSGQNLFKHQVGLFIFESDQLQKNNVQNLTLGRFIAIVERSKKDSNSFEVYGLGNGLELVAGVINQLNENNGAYMITLATPDGQAEALLPQTLYITSYAATLAIVNGLYQP